MWVIGGGEAVLHLQHRDDLGAGWGQKERFKCGQTQGCGWSQGGGPGTGWRREDSGGGGGI